MEARTRHDWPRADALKASIEAAGWRVVDHGNRTSVGPAAPLAVKVDGELRYGSATAVPSRLDAPATNAWTVVVVASEAPERLSRLLAALRAHSPAGTQVVAVVNDPSDSQVTALQPEAPDRAPIGGMVPEVLRTSTHLGYAAAMNIGLRRATGEFVLVTDATAWPTGDALAPLAAALRDPAVAAAGGFGLVQAEPGRLRPNALLRWGAVAAAHVLPATANTAASSTAAAPVRATSESTANVTALEAPWLAFRRDDYRALGPLDERFVTTAWLDVWWTLRLRAGAEPEGAEYEPPEDDEATDGPVGPARPEAIEPGIALPTPRRALRVELPLEREDVTWPPDRSRLNSRNMYRVLGRYGWRDDLG
jgi:hypothetical protein